MGLPIFGGLRPELLDDCGLSKRDGSGGVVGQPCGGVDWAGARGLRGTGRACRRAGGLCRVGSGMHHRGNTQLNRSSKSLPNTCGAGYSRSCPTGPGTCSSRTDDVDIAQGNFQRPEEVACKRQDVPVKLQEADVWQRTNQPKVGVEPGLANRVLCIKCTGRSQLSSATTTFSDVSAQAMVSRVAYLKNHPRSHRGQS